MGNNTKPKTGEAAGTAGTEQAAAAPPVQKFLVEKLRKDSIKLFGVTTSTFDGAMYGHGEPEMSIDEAKAIIDLFLYGDNGGNE